MTRRQVVGTRQVDLFWTRRREDKLLELGKSTYSGQEDEKTSCWNLASRLILDKKTRRQVVGTRQVDLFWTRRREDKLLELGKSTYSGQEDEKTSCWNSASRLTLDKKTRRQVVGTLQVDLFWTRRRVDKLLELDKSSCPK